MPVRDPNQQYASPFAIGSGKPLGQKAQPKEDLKKGNKTAKGMDATETIGEEGVEN